MSEAVAIAPAAPADVDAIMACERRPGYEDTVGRWSREEHLAGMADAHGGPGFATLAGLALFAAADDLDLRGAAISDEVTQKATGGGLWGRLVAAVRSTY